MIENNLTLNNYFEIGKLIEGAQGGSERAKYGNRLIKNVLMKKYYLVYIKF